MKKLIMVLPIIGYLLLGITLVAYAIDGTGCLTCHQYPGLVSVEEAGKVRILHIDEAKYRKSSHGNLDCRECHSRINKIPHTGETVVNCAITCHHDRSNMEYFETETNCNTCHAAYKNIKTMEHYLNNFHRNEQTALRKLQSESPCRVCHELYPHFKDNKIRAYVNLHAGFMLCEVCHLRHNQNSRSDVCGECHRQKENLTYEWGTPEGAEYNGDPFGIYRNNGKYEPPLRERIINLIAGTILKITSAFTLREDMPEEKKESKYLLSRIGVFTVDKGRKKPLINTSDTEKAIKVKEVKGFMSSSKWKKRSKYFHRDVAKLDISVVCNECHSADSMLDYGKLGFTKTKSNMLKRLNIKGLVLKYDTFYLPKFLFVSKRIL